LCTGFPCLLDYPIHTETDGPPGAVAIAKSLLAMGKIVTIVTDECNEDVLLACVAGSSLIPKYSETLSLESFPPAAVMGDNDYKRLAEYNAQYDLFIAIERAGPNQEGFYRTMRNRDMTHLIAPLEDILMSTNDDGEVTTKSMSSIGVGKL
jgi:D-glutamate cyclase